MASDSRPRYEPGPKAFNLSQLRYEEPPPPGYEVHGRGKSVDVEPLERGLGDKRYEPPPQVTPPVPSVQYTQPQSINNPIVSLQPKSVLAEDFQNSPLSKPELPPPLPQNKPAAFRSSSREDTVQATYYPQKSFPDKGPINGVEQLAKTTTPAYNRFTTSSKPYTSAARPFERKFESPKFNHNLLPEETLPKPSEIPSAKPQHSPQPLLKAHSSTQPEFESNLESFSSQGDKLKYQPNNISAVPKAIPVRRDAPQPPGHVWATRTQIPEARRAAFATLCVYDP
ncbi:Tight junction protein ZO-1, partial [Ophiophagus hannah]